MGQLIKLITPDVNASLEPPIQDQDRSNSNIPEKIPEAG
jgi:hypothetical protein